MVGNTPENCVYFAKPVGADGPIKIGFSWSPERRVAALSGTSRINLEIITQARGSFVTENDIHRKFRAYRCPAPYGDECKYRFGENEWYHPVAPLLDFIGKVSRCRRIPLEPWERAAWIVQTGRQSGKTYAEIGRELGVSRQRVHQMHQASAA